MYYAASLLLAPQYIQSYVSFIAVNRKYNFYYKFSYNLDKSRGSNIDQLFFGQYVYTYVIIINSGK